MNHIVLELTFILLLVLANGVLAGAEIAVVTTRRTRLEELLENGKKSARAVLLLKDNPEGFLATVQIGITLVSATAAAFSGASIARELSPRFAEVQWLAPHAEDLALAVVIIGVSYLSIVVGELVPKSLALRNAERYALLVGRPLLALAWLARPFVWTFTKTSNALLKPFRDQTTFTETKYSIEELQQLVGEATKAGSVHPEAGEIASRAFDFAGLSAVDVMVPRQEVVMLPRKATASEVQQLLLEHIHTRLPVFDGAVDNVVGYVNVKDILAVAWDPRLFILEDLLRPAFFAPESLSALDLLKEMKQRRLPFAIIVDEQGGMAGIATMEDLVEELVGEIFSEHAAKGPALIEQEPGGTALVSGLAPVREVNRELDLELPEGDYTTLAGLCLALAGRIPTVGDTFTVADQAMLEIVDASSRRVRSVRVRPLQGTPGSGSITA
ncbi:MAG TPA: hemolysin family protein, partial [Polyangiaceae bacterium]|nr:hemolysin family protein [Polyangiaceae bacterium]